MKHVSHPWISPSPWIPTHTHTHTHTQPFSLLFPSPPQFSPVITLNSLSSSPSFFTLIGNTEHWVIFLALLNLGHPDLKTSEASHYPQDTVRTSEFHLSSPGLQPTHPDPFCIFLHIAFRPHWLTYGSAKAPGSLVASKPLYIFCSILPPPQKSLMYQFSITTLMFIWLISTRPFQLSFGLFSWVSPPQYGLILGRCFAHCCMPKAKPGTPICASEYGCLV